MKTLNFANVIQSKMSWKTVQSLFYFTSFALKNHTEAEMKRLCSCETAGNET